MMLEGLDKDIIIALSKQAECSTHHSHQSRECQVFNISVTKEYKYCQSSLLKDGNQNEEETRICSDRSNSGPVIDWSSLIRLDIVVC